MVSGLRKEQIRCSLGVLKATYSVHSLGAESCHRLKVRVGRAFSPLKLLASSRDWAFVWRGREDGFLTLALDALQVVTDADQLKVNRDSVLQWFGGEPFAEEGSAEWGDLSHGVWFLPAITWRLAADESILIVQALSSAPERSLSLSEKMVALLDKAVAADDILPIAPSLLERRDIPDFAGWKKSLVAAQKAFAQDRLSKVVLSRSSLLKLDRSESWLYWISRLLAYEEESYVFALKGPSGRTFLGRSPERLLAWKDGQFQIDAIAGTRRGGQASRDLKSSSKDLVEHRHVTRYIANLLHGLDLAYELVDDEALLQLTHVQHLRSRFQGYLTPQTDAIELLNALHPTPAVGGAPTSAATEFILANEVSERGLYAGFIGWCGGRSGECAIAIRSALLYDDVIRVFAGAGIVPDSDIEAEWEETEMKMQNFLFGLAGHEDLSSAHTHGSRDQQLVR
jgi:isochorismate synthase